MTRVVVAAIIVAVVAVALGVVSTLRRENPGEPYGSGDQLLREIRAVHDCEGRSAQGSVSRAAGVEFAACMDDNPNEASAGDVDVWLYEDESDVGRALEFGLEQRANTADETWKDVHFIAGPNWLVRTYSRPTAEKIHARLGGSLR